MWSSGVQIVVSVLLALVTTCQGHVSLVYPPARTYAIDFLDNVRTVPPCGMARGWSLLCVTSCSSSLVNLDSSIKYDSIKTIYALLLFVIRWMISDNVLGCVRYWHRSGWSYNFRSLHHTVLFRAVIVLLSNYSIMTCCVQNASGVKLYCVEPLALLGLPSLAALGDSCRWLLAGLP